MQAITAAHCIDPIIPIESITLEVGTNSLSQQGDIYDPLLFIRHELYPGFEFPFHYDIGLIKTVRNIRFHSRVQPIPLSSEVVPDGAFPLIKAGWGSIDGTRENIPDKMQYLYATNLGRDKCEEYYQGNPWYFQSQLCAVTPAGFGHCWGDSGGPVTYGGKLVGLMSWVDEECSTESPDMSASVPYFYDWIQRKLVENS